MSCSKKESSALQDLLFPVLSGGFFFSVRFRAVYSFSFILMSPGQIEKKPPALASFK